MLKWLRSWFCTKPVLGASSGLTQCNECGQFLPHKKSSLAQLKLTDPMTDEQLVRIEGHALRSRYALTHVQFRQNGVKLRIKVLSEDNAIWMMDAICHLAGEIRRQRKGESTT